MATRNDGDVVNGITMPPLYNKRAGQMWDIISQHVDFKGKRVIDLGCGHGDLLVRAYAAGAYHVTGYDIDKDAIDDTSEKLGHVRHEELRLKINNNRPLGNQTHLAQVDSTETEWPLLTPDILICCSVLPYLELPFVFLEDMYNFADMSIIECQYAGDGPGFIADDYDMQGWLEWTGWSTVTPIGKTFVEGRDKWRTIWKCER